MNTKLRNFYYFSAMIWLDFVIIALLLLGAWQGWRQGVVTQVLGLAALALGIWMGWRHGLAIGSWIGLEGLTAQIVGFIAVLAVVIVAVVLLGRATRGLFKIVGLGVFDNILGVLFSCLKMVLFVGLFAAILRALTVAIPQSTMMARVDGICNVVFPFVKSMFL